jgi:Arc/MetJ-type ribon-helix-helix transcriptional regulator
MSAITVTDVQQAREVLLAKMENGTSDPLEWRALFSVEDEVIRSLVAELQEFRDQKKRADDLAAAVIRKRQQEEMERKLAEAAAQPVRHAVVRPGPPKRNWFGKIIPEEE